MGDVSGVPDTVIQVTNRQDVAAAVRHKPLECEEQRLRAGVDFAATFVRIRGGEYRVVLTVEQFAMLWREAQAWARRRGCGSCSLDPGGLHMGYGKPCPRSSL